MRHLGFLYFGYPIQGLTLTKSRLHGSPPTSVSTEINLLGGLLTVSVAGVSLFRDGLVTAIVIGRVTRSSTHDGPHTSSRLGTGRCCGVAWILRIARIIMRITTLGLRFHGGIDNFVRPLFPIFRIVIRSVRTTAGSRSRFVELGPSMDVVAIAALALRSSVELIPHHRSRGCRRTIRTPDIGSFLENFIQTVGV